MDADTPTAKASRTRKRRTRHERRTVGEGFEADTLWRVPAAVISAAACPSAGTQESKISKKDIDDDDGDKFIKIIYGCGHQMKKNGGIRLNNKFGW